MTSRRVAPKAVFKPLSLSKISGVRYFFRRDLDSVPWSFLNAASSFSAVAASTIVMAAKKLLFEMRFRWEIEWKMYEK